MSEQLPPESRIIGESPTLGALGAALAKAQGAMGNAVKKKNNPHYKSKYADLAAVWDVCRAPLAANALAVIQRVATRRDMVVIRTKLIHASNEWIEEELEVPLAQRTAQGVAAAATYGRRVGLSAMVGVAPEDEDDDGNEASGITPKEEGKREAPRQQAAKQSRTEETKEKLAKLNAPPTAWQKIVELGALYGMTETQMVSYCRDPLAGKTRAQLGEEDVRKIQDLLSITGKAAGAPQ